MYRVGFLPMPLPGILRMYARRYVSICVYYRFYNTLLIRWFLRHRLYWFDEVFYVTSTPFSLSARWTWITVNHMTCIIFYEVRVFNPKNISNLGLNVDCFYAPSVDPLCAHSMCNWKRNYYIWNAIRKLEMKFDFNFTTTTKYWKWKRTFPTEIQSLRICNCPIYNVFVFKRTKSYYHSRMRQSGAWLLVLLFILEQLHLSFRLRWFARRSSSLLKVCHMPPVNYRHRPDPLHTNTLSGRQFEYLTLIAHIEFVYARRNSVASHTSTASPRIKQISLDIVAWHGEQMNAMSRATTSRRLYLPLYNSALAYKYSIKFSNYGKKKKNEDIEKQFKYWWIFFSTFPSAFS